ncbi:MAG: iron transporter [Solirubrobacteraceae bacterium]
MRLTTPRRSRLTALAVAALSCVALAACGSSTGLSSAGSGDASQMPAAKARTVTNPAATSMTGMQMGTSAAKSMSAGGIKAIPTQTLGTADWQGMKIQARAMTAVPFVIYDGTHEQMVKPPKHVSFHLMVDLNDARTGVAIPYAGVWATITRQGRTVYDERQWPMISEYMGPHYGNNVALPGPGTYRLSLLISPPVSARHVEYRNVWLKPDRVTMSFRWQPS